MAATEKDVLSQITDPLARQHKLRHCAQQIVEFCQKPQNKSVLIKLITQAKEAYDKPPGYLAFNIVYYFTRARDSDFETLLSDAQEFDGVVVLASLLTFFSKGEWNEGSANTELLNLLIEQLELSNEDKNHLKNNQCNEVRVLVKDILSTRISSAHQVAEKAKERLAELKKIFGSHDDEGIDNMELVLLQGEVPKNYEPKAAYTIFIQLAGQENKLFWYDACGQCTELSTENAPGGLFSKMKQEGLKALTPIQKKQFNAFCKQQINKELARVKLVIGSKTQETNAYLLEYCGNQWQLQWCNAIGRRQSIDLADHPELNEILTDLPDSQPKEQVQKIIQILLLKVKPPANRLNLNKFQHINDALAGTPVKPRDSSAVRPAVPAVKPEIQPLAPPAAPPPESSRTVEEMRDQLVNQLGVNFFNAHQPKSSVPIQEEGSPKPS